MKNNPKILFLDIENLAHLIWAWDTYETNAIEVERAGHLISMAYKWQGKKTEVIAQCDLTVPVSDCGCSRRRVGAGLNSRWRC